MCELVCVCGCKTHDVWAEGEAACTFFFPLILPGGIWLSSSSAFCANDPIQESLCRALPSALILMTQLQHCSFNPQC